MVELELLQRRERPVAFLCESKPALLELVGLQEAVVTRAWLTQERQGDQQHTGDGEHGTDDQRDGQMRTAASA
jgi:hypothetical protein